MRTQVASLSGLIALAAVVSACTSPTAVPTTTSQPTHPPRPSATEPPATSTPLPTATATLLPLFLDDFTSSLEPGWTWIRENDALWSLDSQPGFLRIVLQRGGGPHLRNILLREATSENFQIISHVLFEPTSNFQGAGLIVYQDDLNTVALIRAYCNIPGQCVGNGIYFDNIQSGNLTGTNFGTDTVAKDEAYLRIDKTGSTLTGYYSEDGSNWVTIGAHDAPLADPKVGLLAGNSNVVGATAYFDYFMLQDMP